MVDPAVEYYLLLSTGSELDRQQPTPRLSPPAAWTQIFIFLPEFRQRWHIPNSYFWIRPQKSESFCLEGAPAAGSSGQHLGRD